MNNLQAAKWFYWYTNQGGGAAVAPSGDTSFTFEDGTTATDESGNTMITE